jgi:hypothetical protein
MNRIILIGNGFDLAHGLKTSYNDFIDDFWDKKTDVFKRIIRTRTIGVIQDNLLTRTPTGYRYNDNDIYADIVDFDFYFPIDAITQGSSGFNEFSFVISQLRIKENENNLHFNNHFLERITFKKQLEKWVDIEEEYYLALLDCVQDKSGEKIKQLNNDFLMIQTALEEYLKSQSKNKIVKSPVIDKNICYAISYDDTVTNKGKHKLYNFLYLSFNYTSLENNYISPANKVIHIHGEIGNPQNPIIFGYGDEIDEKYKLIEQTNDNNYLENIKSIKYAKTRNYREMINFINSDVYEVFIMGHSCGISDRTLLNKLFEHENCLSIKVFYYKNPDGTDNHNDIVKNISRNFNKKELFRERIVAWVDSVPLS